MKKFAWRMFWTLRTLSLFSVLCARLTSGDFNYHAIRKKLCHNCAIVPSRARAWFENKRFDWLSLNFFVHWPIGMFTLLPFLQSITSFLHCVKENCTFLSQSESSIFFMYIINTIIYHLGNHLFFLWYVESQILLGLFTTKDIRPSSL